MTVLIHEILYLANQLWCIDFFTPPTPLIILHSLPAILESLMPLKNWCSIHARCSKSSLKHTICFCGIFSKFKTEFYCISFFKSPDCIFEIHQLWQPGFSRVYSNCCCSCSFEAEIIKIGQSSHKMYSNNILNFQESTTILNACTKKSGNLLNAPYILLFLHDYISHTFIYKLHTTTVQHHYNKNYNISTFLIMYQPTYPLFLMSCFQLAIYQYCCKLSESYFRWEWNDNLSTTKLCF